MNMQDIAAALASTLPEAIGSEPRAGSLHRRDIGVIQAERLAESGYVLLHGEHVDDATVERAAKGLYGHYRYEFELPWEKVAQDDPDEAIEYRAAALAVLAALAAPADEQAEVDRG